MNNEFSEWYEKNGKGIRFLCAVIGICMGLAFCKELGLIFN